MGFEARHNGVLVSRHEDPEHLKKIHAHLDEDGALEISEGRPYELHALGDGADAIIDSFSSLEEAKEKREFYANPQLHEDGTVRREARFPQAEVRDASGRVLHPIAVLDEPLADAPADAPADAADALSASEATTDPAPAA